jgi:hypothetical protein
MTHDRNILDLVNALNRDFRHNPAFMILCHKLSEHAERRIAALYVRWLHEVTEKENVE